MGTRFDAIIQRCAKEMAGGQVPVVGTTTADGGVASLIDVTNLKDARTKPDATAYKNQWVRLTISATENIRRIGSYVPADGELVPLADFSAAPGTANTYEIHRRLDPTVLKECICEGLGDMRRTSVRILTLVPDGDLEGATIGDNWAATNASMAYDTDKVLFGKQSLKVTSTSADGHVKTKVAIPVTPGEPLVVWAPVYGDESKAELILRDATAGADIETARHDEKGWAILFFLARVPDDCYEVEVWLRTKDNTSDTYWDHVGLLKRNQRVYDAPSWLLQRRDFDRLVSYGYGAALQSDNARNAYRMWQLNERRKRVLDLLPTEAGVVKFRLGLRDGPGEPLFVVGQRPFAALSADADETNADEEAIVAISLAHAYERLGPDHAGDAAKWARRYNDLSTDIEPRLKVRMVSPWRR